jgi:hypothetical protein
MGQTVPITQTSQSATPVVEDEPEDAPAPRKRPLLNLITGTGNSATSPDGAVVGSGTGTSRPTPIKDAVTAAGE